MLQRAFPATSFVSLSALLLSAACATKNGPVDTAREPQQLARAPLSFAIMGPLVIGDPARPNDPSHATAWKDFEEQLAFFKSIGVEAVSTDVWWGVVEPRDNQFQWAYYDRLAASLETAGLKWVPILSFHQCGGNVGDTCNIPLPNWIWPKYARGTPDGIQFKSEQGNLSRESISVWGSAMAINEYRDLMLAFQRQYAAKRDMITEINVSLGPAGELRYPSYNSHDQGTGYPTRGAFQAYSTMALKDFREFVRRKYMGQIASLNRAWETSHATWDTIQPPASADVFFTDPTLRNGAYGHDFLDWYSESLRRHGERVLKLAFWSFNSGQAPFRGIEIGAKIPGIHWRMGRLQFNTPVFSDRGAELTTGLISGRRTDWDERGGYGYRPLLEMFSRLQRSPGASPFILHFTALEMDDADGDPAAESLAKSLVRWVGREAKRQNLKVKGENALAGTLGGQRAWDNIEDALEGGSYAGLTVLRMGDLYANPFGREAYRKLIERERQRFAR